MDAACGSPHIFRVLLLVSICHVQVKYRKNTDDGKMEGKEKGRNKGGRESSEMNALSC
jgi:hypothetical protein